MAAGTRGRRRTRRAGAEEGEVAALECALPRHVAGATPTIFLKARLNDASESWPTSRATADTFAAPSARRQKAPASTSSSSKKPRSEERRVGKECRSRWGLDDSKKKKEEKERSRDRTKG